MKKILIISLLFIHHFSTAVGQKILALKPINVFLIGGQSNATGQGYLSNLPKGFKIDTNVLIFHSGKPHLNSGRPSNTWLPLHQASESPDRFGPELGFGNRLHELLPDKKIAIIKHAHSGTNLYHDWFPGGDATDTAHFGLQFKIFIETVMEAMQALKQQGFQPVIKGMLWQQGESDADKTPEISQQYGKNLKLLITRIRQQLQSPDMLFVYGYVLPPPVVYTGGAEVRKGQYLVQENSGDSLATPRALLISTEDLSHRANDADTRYPTDHLHFGTAGTYQLGVRMAEKMAMRLTGK